MICLDAWAVIAWVDGDARADAIAESLTTGDAVINWINVGEVAYIVGRRHGVDAADRVVTAVRARCVVDVAAPERVLAAARIKMDSRMSFADAFAVATARAHRSRLATGDPEIIGALAPGEVLDLR